MSWLEPRFDTRLADLSDFARDLLVGLNAPAKHIPAKHFYDERGSALFDRICELPEYYPTRTEMSLLRCHAPELARLMGPDITLVEFGAGALRKVEVLLNALRRPRAYVPVDISGTYLQTMAAKLNRSRPNLSVHPIVADFTKPFGLPTFASGERRVGFFPGSTIGNLSRNEALEFLRHARSLVGGMLIGVDLVKDPAILHAAYNDSAGVTAAFNKNLLYRANRELGADFDAEAFAHYAFYNPIARRIEMHLMSRYHQVARVLGREVVFDEGEAIHTENSHKYTIEDFQRLAISAGFVPARSWKDEKKLFSLHWLEAAG